MNKAAGSKAGWVRTIFYLAITGSHACYLNGFIPVSGLLFLSFIGGILLYFGLKKLVSSLLGSPIKVSSLIAVVPLLGVGTLTLIPGWPDSLLRKTPFGWPILEARSRLLDRAMYDDDIAMVRKIAWVGVGDPAPRDPFGHPLIYDAKNPEMLRILLDSGLDPDARDEDTTTLLMRTQDEKMASVLLAGGANPNARDENGRTPLMYVRDANVELIKLLAENGAQVNTVDDYGKTVADWLGNSPQIDHVLSKYAHGGVHRSTDLNFLSHARRDWLEQDNLEMADLLKPSEIRVIPDPIAYGDLAEIKIRISNATDTDRVIKVEATLNSEALFVDTSHGGRIINPYQPQLNQEIGWPLLALPARSSGVFKMTIIARDAWDGGDLSIDVQARNVLTYSDDETIFLNHYQPLSETAYHGQSAGSWPKTLLGALIIPLPLFILFGAWKLLGKEHPVTTVTIRLVAGIFSVLFAMIAYSSTVDLVGPYTSFEKSEALILDRRFYLKSETTSGSSNRRSTTTIHRIPIIAARYATSNGVIISTGPASFQFFRERDLGAVVPCWYDPKNPYKFVVVKNIGILSIIAIILSAIGCLVLACVALKGRMIILHDGHDDD